MPSQTLRHWSGRADSPEFLSFVRQLVEDQGEVEKTSLDQLVTEISKVFVGFSRLPTRAKFQAAAKALTLVQSVEQNVNTEVYRAAGCARLPSKVGSRIPDGNHFVISVQESSRETTASVKRHRQVDPNMPHTPPRAPLSRSSFLTARPKQRYEDIGGIESILSHIRELVEWPLRYTELYKLLGVDPPRGVLLHGPPGCGKTLLANAIAGELGVPFLRLSAPELIAGISGESEQRVRSLFDEAKSLAPSLIFIDEIDAVTSRRETSSREMQNRVIAQLLSCLDSISLQETGDRLVIVIGATNRAEALDPALRRAGRFDREIEIGAPDEEAREKILRNVTRRMLLSEDFNFRTIARRTAGYVGADLAALATEAASTAIRRIGNDLLPTDTTVNGAASVDFANISMLRITIDDFLVAIGKVQPSALREGFATVPDVSWEDIGALDDIREELEMAVIEPLREPEKFARFGIGISAGVLLYGPPGCGKTLLAKAVANESGANFISVKGPELLDKYVGESERAVRRLFQRARSSAPCVIFFDELDALAPRRAFGSFGASASADNDAGGSNASERLVNQLLTELDGMNPRRQVFVIAATNRPDLIDAAMLRPGRFDKLLYVPLPDETGRHAILQTGLRGMPLDSRVDLRAVSGATKGFSGADIAALIREAAVRALRSEAPAIGAEHFRKALENIFPSVSPGDAARYDSMRQNLRRARGHVNENIFTI